MDLREMERTHVLRMHERAGEIEKIKHELNHNLKRKTMSLDKITIPKTRDTALVLYSSDDEDDEPIETVHRFNTPFMRPQTALPRGSNRKTGFLGYSAIREDVTPLSDGKRLNVRRQAITQTRALTAAPARVKTQHRVRWA